MADNTSEKRAVDEIVAKEAEIDSLTVKEFIAMLKMDDYVVLDTETTGLHEGQICQIAVMSSAGEILLNTLVNPVGDIPVGATQIHGITKGMVVHSPTYAEILPRLQQILTGRNVVVYNAVYDRRMMHQSGEAAKLPKVDWKKISTWWCAMEVFAELYGDWSIYRQSYTWKSLSIAARYYDIPVESAHDALGDVKMTLAVCRQMVNRYPQR